MDVTIKIDSPHLEKAVKEILIDFIVSKSCNFPLELLKRSDLSTLAEIQDEVNEKVALRGEVQHLNNAIDVFNHNESVRVAREGSDAHH